MSTSRTIATSTSASLAEAEGEYGTAQSYEAVVVVGDAAPKTGDGAALVVVGDATAVGTDTLAQLQVEATITDGAAFASVDTLAAASSVEGLVFTGTSASIDYAGDADVFFSLGQTSSFTEIDEEGALSVSTTSLDFAAVSLTAEIAPPEELPELGTVPPLAPPDAETSTPVAEGCGCAEGEIDSPQVALDGNLALFEIQASAFGDDSLAEVNADVIAVDEQFSSATAVVVIAIA